VILSVVTTVVVMNLWQRGVTPATTALAAQAAPNDHRPRPLPVTAEARSLKRRCSKL
jgi:hypothetical protein